MILKGGPLAHTSHAAQMHSTDRQQPHTDRLGSNVARLRQIEEQMDALFRRLLHRRDEHALTDATERLDELILAYPELRLPQVANHRQATRSLLAQIDLDHGPLPGFQEAMEELCALCLTPDSLGHLRSQLYTVAARLTEERPDLLPTAALAALSARPPYPAQTLFTEMVLCASAIEWGLDVESHTDAHVSLDVSTWLIAEPTRGFLAAVGKDRAHYYASIPGVLPFLDPNRILFDVQQLEPARSPYTDPSARSLDDLASPGYTRRLRTEIKRVQGALRETYPDPTIADVVLLTHRALEALDDLPVQVNPLLQAIWIQSWVRHMGVSGQIQEIQFTPYM